MTDLHVDLFAGPGGWSEAMRMLGLREVGLEWDTAACLTRRAAGHVTIQCDVAAYPTEPFKGRIRGLIASPTCTPWSRAGKGGGVKDQRIVHELIAELAKGIDNRADIIAKARAARQRVDEWDASWRAAADAHEDWWTDRVVREADATFQGLEAEPAQEPGKVTVKVLSPHGRRERTRLFGPCPELLLHDEQSILAAEPMRWLYDLRPEWIAMEQVPDVLPLWKQYAEVLRGWGYSVWCGELNAADYGVPQTRRRAILTASRVRSVTAPPPTHTQHPMGDDLFGESRQRWVSMAEALDWTSGVTVNTRGDRKTAGGNDFPDDGPSWALTEKARSWVLRNGNQPNAAIRTTDEPAPTIAFGNNSARVEWVLQSRRDSPRWVASDGPRENRRGDQPAPTFTGEAHRWSWAMERPATTVCSTDRLAPPGHRDRSPGGESQFASPDTIRITQAEAAVLQSFRPDYPWQGSKTKQFEQIGNAVPPLLAAHVVSAATGLPLPDHIRQEAAA